jgi:hypothetical protein
MKTPQPNDNAALPPVPCSACGGLSMIEGSGPDDDVMNTRCPECNPWTGIDADEFVRSVRDGTYDPNKLTHNPLHIVPAFLNYSLPNTKMRDGESRASTPTNTP